MPAARRSLGGAGWRSLAAIEHPRRPHCRAVLAERQGGARSPPAWPRLSGRVARTQARRHRALWLPPACPRPLSLPVSVRRVARACHHRLASSTSVAPSSPPTRPRLHLRVARCHGFARLHSESGKLATTMTLSWSVARSPA